MENKNSDLWKAAVDRINQLEKMIFTTVGLLLGALYFLFKHAETANLVEIVGLSLILLIINYVFIHLFVVLTVFAQTLVEIEKELVSYNLWLRCLDRLRHIFYVTYVIVFFSPCLLTHVIILYLLRCRLQRVIPIVGMSATISIAISIGMSATVSIGILIVTFRKHYSEYKRAKSSNRQS